MKILGSFLAVLAAIAVAVCLFAPERLPGGIGLPPIPVELGARESLVGEGIVATIRNPTGKTLQNLRLLCRNDARHQQQAFVVPTLEPGGTVEIGWLEGWRFESGETLTITADGYSSREWTWK